MNKNKIFQFLVCLVITTAVGDKAVCQEMSGSRIRYNSFTVSAKQNKIMLDWSTDGAHPTNYFEIQKSTDGKNFKTIALVLGPDPKKADCDCYSGYEKRDRNYKNYYRLKHIDINGTVQFSETRLLNKS
jgi:hypothetical protein